jgi:hypothetical protein
MGRYDAYWLIDRLRHEALFYQGTANGLYAPQQIDTHGYYQTARLPDLRLHVPTLWQQPLPDCFALARMVQAMVDKA